MACRNFFRIGSPLKSNSFSAPPASLHLSPSLSLSPLHPPHRTVMRFNTLVFALASSASVLAQIPGINNSGDAFNAVAGGPAGTFNAITVIQQFYAGSLTPAVFENLRLALSNLPATAITPSSFAIQNAFNAAKLASDQGSATVVDQMQQVSKNRISES